MDPTQSLDMFWAAWEPLCFVVFKVFLTSDRTRCGPVEGGSCRVSILWSGGSLWEFPGCGLGGVPEQS